MLERSHFNFKITRYQTLHLDTESYLNKLFLEDRIGGLFTENILRTLQYIQYNNTYTKHKDQWEKDSKEPFMKIKKCPVINQGNLPENNNKNQINKYK